jgi:hypothetical protein
VQASTRWEFSCPAGTRTTPRARIP